MSRGCAFLLLFLLVMGGALALPELPTEFYGDITSRGQPASVGGSISAQYETNASNVTCASFSIVNSGHFGLLTCAIDEEETPAVEGAPENAQITFYFNDEPVIFLSGDNVTEAGSFKEVVLWHPVPLCGDNYCDSLFESNALCPQDCRSNATGNNSGNATGNGTGGAGGGGSAGGAGGGGAAGGGAGGGGAAGGGAGGAAGGASGATLTPGIVGALAGIAGAAPFGCQEEWVCSAWTNCTIEGLQERECNDKNGCGTSNDKPARVQECAYDPTCYDMMHNGEETGLDCGGSKCEACPGCTNGIQDGEETGLDCGGDCRPCDSCYDGLQNYGETGVDCGGACPLCIERQPAILEFPQLICEKSPNPVQNDARWFFLIIIILLGIRIFIYTKELQRIKADQLLEEFRRAQAYYEKRREMVLFILVTCAVSLLSYGYYYEFLLCQIGYRYLWLFLLLLVLVPLVIYHVLRLLTYSDERKLAVLREETKSHEDLLADMLTFENSQLVDIEKDIMQRIEAVATDVELLAALGKVPEIKGIYNDIITLYYEYHKNKTPTGIEKELCDKVYAIETNENFKKLADEHPEIGVIYQKMALLYHHYEEKQKIYDELEQMRKDSASKEAQIAAGTASAPMPADENDKFDKDADDIAKDKAEEKKEGEGEKK